MFRKLALGASLALVLTLTGCNTTTPSAADEASVGFDASAKACVKSGECSEAKAAACAEAKAAGCEKDKSACAKPSDAACPSTGATKN